MTIKEKFNIRIQRIREYQRNVSRCRDMENELRDAVRNITATYGPLGDDATPACIKTYYMFMHPAEISDTGNVYYTTKYCPYFKDDNCSVYGCSYRYRNAKYKEQQSLLHDAINAKQASFRRIFERIK